MAAVDLTHIEAGSLHKRRGVTVRLDGLRDLLLVHGDDVDPVSSGEAHRAYGVGIGGSVANRVQPRMIELDRGNRSVDLDGQGGFGQIA